MSRVGRSSVAWACWRRCRRPTSAAQQPDPGSLDQLLTRATWYVLDFVEKLSSVVSEERYVQDSSVALMTVPIPGLWAAAARSLLRGRAGIGQAPRAQVRFPDRQVGRGTVGAFSRRVRGGPHPDSRSRRTRDQALPAADRRHPGTHQRDRRGKRALQPRRRAAHDQQSRVRPHLSAAGAPVAFQVHARQARPAHGRQHPRRRIRGRRAADAHHGPARPGHARLRPLLD